MKRILLVMSVAALLVMMVVATAAPAFAAPPDGGNRGLALGQDPLFSGVINSCIHTQFIDNQPDRCQSITG